jgi:hypothetical protein
LPAERRKSSPFPILFPSAIVFSFFTKTTGAD